MNQQNCPHAVRRYDSMIGAPTCLQCGKVLTNLSVPARNDPDFCRVCGNRLTEVQLFTSVTKYCKVCEDRSKQVLPDDIFDDDLNKELDELFKN